MQSANNVVVIAAAGSAKTQSIIDQVMANRDRRALITTFTVENLAQIKGRLALANGGVVPEHVTCLTWFSFVVNQGIRPYQRAVFGEVNYVGSFNFYGKKSFYTAQKDPKKYFLDANRGIYRDGAAHLACVINQRTGGAVVRRLGEMFDDIYIDELQDLNGYDLELLDDLFVGSAKITAVGDPRQHTFSTNQSAKHRKFKGAGLPDWFGARQHLCEVDVRNVCHRSNQLICDLADSLYPGLPATSSQNSESTGHDGIFRITEAEVPEYYREHSPTILRYDRNVDTLGLPAKNVGTSKGSTYDRVIVFPTKTWQKFFATGIESGVTSREKLYVAITRARFSVAWVDR